MLKKKKKKRREKDRMKKKKKGFDKDVFEQSLRKESRSGV